MSSGLAWSSTIALLILLARDIAGRRHATGSTESTVRSTYTYRPDGRLGRLANVDGVHDFTYDSRGQVETQTVSGEGVYRHGYDAMGRNVSLTFPDCQRAHEIAGI